MKFLGQYMQIKKRNMKIAWKKAKMSKTCYLFLLPYAIVFTAFYILPVCMSIFYSFTYYNVLEPARFVGLDNYIKLFLSDDVFLIAIKNTFLLAAITGPLGYIMAFIFAWFINELPRYMDEQYRNQGQYVIGWFHTHPNSLDVFMSRTDMDTQRNFFNQDWHFSVVLNPHRRLIACFNSMDANICRFYPVNFADR